MSTSPARLAVRTFRIGSDHKIIIIIIMVIINIILLSIYGIWFVDQSESAWLRLISLLGSGRIHPHEPLAVYTGMVLYTLDTQYEYKVQIVNPWWLWQKKQQKNKEKVRPAKLLDGPPRAINSQKSVRIERVALNHLAGNDPPLMRTTRALVTINAAATGDGKLAPSPGERSHPTIDLFQRLVTWIRDTPE